METQDLEHRTAIITGASSGIGAATARLLVRHGARVALAARRLDRLTRLADELGPEQAIAVQVDVRNGEDLATLVRRTLDRFGRLDILFANAGVYYPGSIAEVDTEALVSQIDVNLGGVLRSIKAVLPIMLEQRSGDILITSSISAHREIDNEAVYSASKHGVATLAAILRREVAPHGVRVGCISPAIVLNEIWGITDPEVIGRGMADHSGLCSEDVAEIAVQMLRMPARITLRDVVAIAQGQII